MMKWFFALLLAFCLTFGVLFLKSGAWETQVGQDSSSGVETRTTSHRINWDRFFTYVKNLGRKTTGQPVQAPGGR